jgi:glycerate 2-kinase
MGQNNMLLRNYDQLVSHGNVAGRKVVLDILERGLLAGDPYDAVRALVRIEKGKLIVGNAEHLPGPISGGSMPHPRPFPAEPLAFDLDQVDHIYIIGAGKAAQRQAQALEDILGDRLAEGHVIAKKGDDIYLKRCGVTLAGHPLPDEDSTIGAHKLIAVARKARKGDIVFHSESGGGTALMTLPAPGLTLEDVQEVNRVLYFGHGAPIVVANAVRTLLTVLRLKEIRYVGEATYIRLSTDERPPRLKVMLTKRQRGDDFAYAIDLLHQYDCWDEIPESVRGFLMRADPVYAPLRPEEWWDRPHFALRVIGPETMLDAAQARARELGLNAAILASSLSGLEASTIGDAAANVAQEIEAHNRPIQAPCVLLCGGELVVSTGKSDGVGGRNQEFVLAAAPRIEGSERIVIASADSDGSDGPTPAAGAIVDGYTTQRAEQAGYDIYDELKGHNAHPVLAALGDTIDTGVLKTNVQDLRIIYVGP